MLSLEQARLLDLLAPEAWRAPDGNVHAICYSTKKPAVVMAPEQHARHVVEGVAVCAGLAALIVRKDEKGVVARMEGRPGKSKRGARRR